MGCTRRVPVAMLTGVIQTFKQFDLDQKGFRAETLLTFSVTLKIIISLPHLLST